LEKALLAEPDDLATHAAYADWLTETGDPRGELIQVGIALEDPGCSPTERKVLRAREVELLRTYGMQWLGALAEFVIDDAALWQIRLARGWLDSLEIGRLTGEGAQALGKALETRLLRRLIIEEMSGDLARQVGLTPLIQSPYLSNVRVLQLGETRREFPHRLEWITGASIVDFVARLPRLEELSLYNPVEIERLAAVPTLTELRVLLHHTADENDHSAVAALGRASHLKKLTHLHLRGTRHGPGFSEAIVASGLLGRLQMLDLGFSATNDADAATLAACPDVRRLELLDLTNTQVTQAGIDRLKKAGVTVRADHLTRRLTVTQYEVDAHARSDDDDLYDGEIEE
jgi:uncharacterized protein (TIGR02996 family)